MRASGFFLTFALLLACTAAPKPDAAAPETPSPASAAASTATRAPHREVVVRSESDRPIYTPAIRSGDLLFLSGAVGLAPEGGTLVEGGIQPETKRALERIEEILKEAGLGLGDVVKCTVFLADIAEYGAMNEVYREVWPGDPPARTTVAVAPPMQARVEIECIAAYPG